MSAKPPPPVPRSVATLRTFRIAKHFPFFLAVAEELNLHRASERLNIAQSAVSRRISDLERELGDVPLFERQARGVAITPAGRVLAKEVRRILMAIEEAARQVSRVALGDAGSLRVAFSEAMLRRPVLPAVLREFRETLPDVELKAFPLTSDAQRSRLRTSEVDVGFVIEEAGDHEEFDSLPTGVDRFVLAVPADHPLAAESDVAVHQIAGEPLLWPARHVSPRLFDRMIAAFDARGVSPNIAVEVTAVDIAYELAMSGIGIGVITAARADRVPPGVVLRELRDFDLPLPLCMIWRRGDGNPLVARMAEMVRKHLPAEPD
jgi:DNA-binding transcriptional LysR family regulator